MKKLNLIAFLTLSLLVVLVTMPVGLRAQTSTKQHGSHFVDTDGDGYNDNAPDADGDGIPNGQDQDYVRSGSGRGKGFVDADGDGFNDNALDADGDGIPNGQDSDYQRPADGTGQKHMYGNRHQTRLLKVRRLPIQTAMTIPPAPEKVIAVPAINKQACQMKTVDGISVGRSGF
jgi:hypothetical protein